MLHSLAYRNRPLIYETARVRKRSHILLVIAKIAPIILQQILNIYLV